MLYNYIKFLNILNGGNTKKLWTKMTTANKIFSVHRSQEFLKWRYIDNIGFKYLFFGDPKTIGFIVARIENVESDLETHRGLKVFRIIEVVPKHDIVWKGKAEKDMKAFLINELINFYPIFLLRYLYLFLHRRKNLRL